MAKKPPKHAPNPGPGWVLQPNGFWREKKTGNLMYPNGVIVDKNGGPVKPVKGSPPPADPRKRLRPPGVNPLRSDGADVVKGQKTHTDVRKTQQFLRKQGYDVSVDGVMGPETRSAIEDFHKGENKRNPAAWNVSRSRSQARAKAQGRPAPTYPGAKAQAAAAVRPPARRPTRTPASASKDPLTSLLTSLMGGGNVGVAIPGDLGGAVGTMIPLDGTDVGKMLPESAADDLAGLEFDAPIHSTQLELARQPRQAAQNEHDIGTWYGDVLATLGRAAEADKAATAAATQSVGDATKAITASLGGAANEGTPLVAAEGADAVGTLGAMGAAQDFYNRELTPIIGLERSGQLSAERARQSQLRADLASKLTELQGQRGQASRAARLDIIDRNNALAQQRFGNRTGVIQANNELAQTRLGNRLGILQANNELAQTRFGNRMGLMQTLAALQTAAGEQQSRALMDQGRALVNAKRLKDLNTAKANPNSFAAAKPNLKSQVTQAITGALVDPETGSLRTGIDQRRAIQIARDIVRSHGWAALNPAVIAQIIVPALKIAGVPIPAGGLRK